MKTYLNGRVTVSSLAAPSEEDKRILAALSEADRRALLIEALEHAENSGFSDRTPEQIWQAAKAQAEQLKAKNAV